MRKSLILLYRKLNIYLTDTTGVLLRGVQAPLLRGDREQSGPLKRGWKTPMEKIVRERKQTPILLLAVIVLQVVYLFSGCDFSNYSQQGKIAIPFGKSYNYNDILVTRVIDGDTLKLEDGQRVRLIGIDTPEMHESSKLYKDSQRTNQDIRTIQEMGRKAYLFTKNLVGGKRVRLEFDLEKHDKYERLLAYVFLKDGTFVNAQILKEGYASLMTYPPNVKYVDEFKKLYQQARENNRGLWR
jgi:micrococcal nuclease